MTCLSFQCGKCLVSINNGNDWLSVNDKEPDVLPAELLESKDGEVERVDRQDPLSSIGSFTSQQAASPASLILNNFSLEDAVDV